MNQRFWMESEQGWVKQLLIHECVYTSYLATCSADMQRRRRHLHASPMPESFSMSVSAHSGSLYTCVCVGVSVRICTCVCEYACVSVGVSVCRCDGISEVQQWLLRIGGSGSFPVPIIKPPPDTPQCTPSGIEGCPRQDVARVSIHYPPATPH